MTIAQQLIVGIFQDRAQAELAIDELISSGFEQQQIHFAGPGSTASTGGVIERIKKMFVGPDESTDWLYYDLMDMGVPPEETYYYQREFEAGRSIVAVQGTMGMRMASGILARNGESGKICPGRVFVTASSLIQRGGFGKPASWDCGKPRGLGTFL